MKQKLRVKSPAAELYIFVQLYTVIKKIPPFGGMGAMVA